jgi:hypothetical protein
VRVSDTEDCNLHFAALSRDYETKYVVITYSMSTLIEGRVMMMMSDTWLVNSEVSIRNSNFLISDQLKMICCILEAAHNYLKAKEKNGRYRNLRLTTESWKGNPGMGFAHICCEVDRPGAE